MTGIDQILKVARAYGAAQNIEISTVSWRVFGDTKKIAALECGADIQVRRFEQGMQWFSNNWPEAAEWPVDIDRPTPVNELAGADR